jgi:lysophospholipase L1-like esterase
VVRYLGVGDAAARPGQRHHRAELVGRLLEPYGPAGHPGLTASYRAAGDHRFDSGAAAFANQASHSFYYRTGVDVTGGRSRNTVVTFGDSITNGHNSTVGGNDRYPDALAGRLALARRPLAVANSGICGNTLLNGLACFGEKGITRFRRDALGQPGVRTVIFGEGENDIWDSEAIPGSWSSTRWPTSPGRSPTRQPGAAQPGLQLRRLPPPQRRRVPRDRGKH